MAKGKELSQLFVTLGLDDKEFAKGLDKIQKNMVKVGKGMTAIGASIAAGLTTAVYAAAQEQAGIEKLTQSLRNVGVEYDNVRESLEGVINTNQQKTSIADDQQREALSELVAITGDYNRALQLLPLTMDLAIGKDMDMVTAAQVLGRVSEGNTTILTRYGIQLKEGATATEALGELQRKYGGQAEMYGKTLAGQFNLLKNNIGDVMEGIGSTLIPLLTDLFRNRIQPLIERLKKWIDQNPALTKTIVAVTGAIGLLFTALGPVLIALPQMASGLKLLITTLHLKTVAVKLAAAAQWLWNAAMTANPIGIVIVAVAALVAALTVLITKWDDVVRFITGGVNDADRAFKKWTDNVRKNSNDMVSSVEDAFSSWKQSASDTTNAITDELRNQVNAARTAHDEKMKLLNEEQLAELARVDKQAALRLKMLQGQKDAISAEIEEKRRARQTEAENARIAEFEERIREETDAERQRELQEELADYIKEINFSRWEQEQRDIQDSLSAQMDAVRESAELRKQSIEDEYKQKKETAENDLKTTIETIDGQVAAETAGLHERIALYDEDLAAFKTMNDGKIEDVQAFVDEYNRLMGEMGADSSKIISQPEIPEDTKQPTVDESGKVKTSGFDWSWLLPQEFLFPSYAGYEGRVPGMDGQPQLAVIHGGEYISQKPSSGVVNNFNIGEMVVREDADIHRIARELYRMQDSKSRAGE
jgi:hypothetical protein